MNRTLDTSKQYDRTAEDQGNIIEMGHVNLFVVDQNKAAIFYGAGLGLTRDPVLSIDNIGLVWFNVGRDQVHLPMRPKPQVLRGTIGLIVPDVAVVESRLSRIAKHLDGTSFGFERKGLSMEVRCPWGNRYRLHEPDSRRFGTTTLGIPYVEFDVRPGTLGGIARFYSEILGALASVERDDAGDHTRVVVGRASALIFRETEREQPAYDGHHIQVTAADFSGPYRRLLERDLVTEESSQHQYRFEDIVDPQTNEVLFKIEHEVRSVRHPLYGRPLFNRDPSQGLVNYVPGHDGGQF